jgi:glucose-6-phosphate 1-dehydrogenase
VVIFGASGDLAKRKLIPSLYNLQVHGLLPENFAVLGVARSENTDESFRKDMTKAINQHATVKVDTAEWKKFEKTLFYQQADYSHPDTYKTLKKRLAEFDEKLGTGGNYLYYLSVPPEVFDDITSALGESGLVREDEGHWRRVIVEKPFGHDYESAVELNRKMSAVLTEQQTFRIDHYLGKETVQNLLVFRFGNGIFEPIWNRRYIDHVQITAAESIGVERRGSFYESAGALRDVMQNHMLMLLSLVAMEPPTSLQGESVRREKTKLLEAVKIMSPEDVLHNAVRGQYGPGEIDGEHVRGYREEEGVNPTSNVETFAALKLEVENWRWAGVPFYLRTGKRMQARSTQIVIQFREAPLPLYGGSRMSRIGPNRLLIQIQPCEGITLQVRAKVPGPTLRTQPVGLNFNYSNLGASPSTGYETLLYDCMMNDATLFHRIDTVLNSWQVVQPALDVWNNIPPRDFPNYASGTWGPKAAEEMIERDGHTWWRSGC